MKFFCREMKTRQKVVVLRLIQESEREIPFWRGFYFPLPMSGCDNPPPFFLPPLI